VLVLAVALTASAARASDHRPALNALYADPLQPDISGVWAIKSAPEFTFAPDRSVPELIGKFKVVYDKRMRAFKPAPRSTM